MKTKVILTAATAATAAAFSLLHAQTVPQFMNYQGRVTDNAGNPLANVNPENRKVIFRIFDAANAGSRLWSEQQTATIFKGEFNVLLGQGTNAVYNNVAENLRPPLQDLFATGGSDRFLEVVVDNGDGTLDNADQPITPRQRLTTTAYSFRARTADSIATGADLQLNGSANYGLGYYGGTRLFNGTAVDGPVMYGNAGGALGSNVNGTQNIALRWNASGNVGIGNVSPTEKLDITGNLKVSGTGLFGAPVTINNGVAAPANGTAGSTGQRIVLWPGDASNTPFGFGIDASNMYTVVPGSAKMTWFTGTTERMVLSNDGKLGIGTTAPSERLHVSGNATVSGNTTVNGQVRAGGAFHTDFGTASHPQGAYLEWNKSGNDGMTYLLNQRGTGPGGFVFGQVDSGNTITYSGMRVGGNITVDPTNSSIYHGGGILLNHAFGAAYSDSGGITGSYIAFGDPGASEDYLGYRSNTFYLKDSPGGGDGSPPHLNVGGNIVSNNKDVPVAEEQLRIIRGNIIADTEGANFTANQAYSSPQSGKLVGSGYSFTRVHDDEYIITFNTAFSSTPTVTWTPEFSIEANRIFPKIKAISTTSVTLRNNADDGSTGHRCKFHFIVVGPR
jgi:hypothetical protein